MAASSMTAASLIRASTVGSGLRPRAFIVILQVSETLSLINRGGNLRVLIVGGGVAGPAAARGLTAAGHDVEVDEAAPELRTEGGSVTIWPGAIGILREFAVDLDGAGPGR
ncbi:hypothetical protein [Thermomonospora umbrina]|uniref:hypothetical protein n=1 Tax=Thermomonospora umbrina TaxID=111806 RepID=UPI001B874E18|nr:hypothetical protein [Thermomonospora umbrina]